MVARLAGQLLARVQELNAQIDQLEADLVPRVRRLAPSLLALRGCGVLTAAKLVGETADIRRFHSKDAYARHNGTAPLPVWSANKQRYRLSRTGNRQLNLALHRIALTQARHHPDAQRYLARRRAGGNTPTEAIRALKRRLSDVVYRALLADAGLADEAGQAAAA
jgi:transposase